MSVGYEAFEKYKGQDKAGIKAREHRESVGYDGVNNEYEEFIAFSPNQIKSATDNIGTYDGENGDIRFSKKPRRLLLNKDLGIDEKIAIQKHIESLPEDTDNSHPLYFENNDYIYIFNTLLSRYEENIKDGDRFEVLRKYNLNKLSNGKRKEIKRLTGNVYTSNGKAGEFRGKRDGTIGGGLHTSRTGTTAQIDGVDIKNDKNEQTEGRRNSGKSDVD